MYNLTEDNNKLMVSDELRNETLHVIHCSKKLSEIKEECKNYDLKPYMVGEYFSNFPRLHLILSYSENEALQEVDEIIRDEDPEFYNDPENEDTETVISVTELAI